MLRKQPKQLTVRIHGLIIGRIFASKIWGAYSGGLIIRRIFVSEILGDLLFFLAGEGGIIIRILRYPKFSVVVRPLEPNGDTY